MRDIRNEIQNIGDVIPIPSMVTMILTQTLTGETAGRKLIAIIESDASLTAMVLRAANSAFYGIRSGVSTVSHAVMVLGHQEINRLVLTYELKQRILSLNTEQRDFLNRLWIHSVSVATASRIVAKAAGVRTSGEEFTAGLLHDMGKIVLVQHFPDMFVRAAAMGTDLGLPDVQAEEQVFAISHDEVGGMLAEQWNLPASIADTMRFHHRCGSATADVPLTCVVRLADLLVERWGIGIDEGTADGAVTDNECWKILSDRFPSIASVDVQEFEEGVRMEFENNQAFSELFT
ncbi:MAG: HDOD domain-containing protein [Bacteroidetes bacterium]|nr:MAG: HDOD domain-containing protein [Bacteroidota bacterium]